MTSTSLFKYRKFDKGSIELLVNCQLWFAKPSSLNDPFEGESSCSEVLDAVWADYPLPKDKQKKYKKIIKKILEDTGICSFSRTRKNQLMWAHYADEHKGICIGFNESLLKATYANIDTIDITYQTNYPFTKIIDRLKYYSKSDKIYDDIHIAGEILHSVLGTKYSHWKYEQERRLISQKSQTIEFPEKAVISIAFGLRMLKRDKLTLKKLLSGKEWDHVKWYQAEKSTIKYGLVFKKI